MKKLFSVLLAVVCLFFFLGQATAREIRVSGYSFLAGMVYNKIIEYFPSVSVVYDPSLAVEEGVVFFIGDDGSVLGTYIVPLHAFSGGEKQILPPALLACVQVFTGINPAKDYRAGQGQKEIMTSRHSSGLDVHFYVPIFTPYIEVVDREDGTVTIKWTIASWDYRVCYYRFDVLKEVHRAFIPRGWVRLPFMGDGNPDVLTGGGALYGPPTGYGGF